LTTREQDKLDEVHCAYCREKFETWQEAEKHLSKSTQGESAKFSQPGFGTRQPPQPKEKK